jgi:hypothetical protein
MNICYIYIYIYIYIYVKHEDKYYIIKNNNKTILMAYYLK